MIYLQLTHQRCLAHALHAIEADKEWCITTASVFFDLIEDEGNHYRRLVICEGGHIASFERRPWSLVTFHADVSGLPRPQPRHMSPRLLRTLQLVLHAACSNIIHRLQDARRTKI